jgi:tRNA nucleotidyltransferase/poly(A) polymerase
MLRGIRLAAYLDFRIEENTWGAIIRQRHHLSECAVSRSREEIMKMLQRGNTRRAFGMLLQAGILDILLPKLKDFLNSSQDDLYPSPEPLWRYLETLDEVRTGRGSFSDPVLLAAFTAAPVHLFLQSLTPGQEIGKALYHFLEEIFKPLAIPRLARSQTTLIHLALRHMLTTGRRKRKRSLRKSPLFPDAMKFLELHCRATNEGWTALEHWCQSPYHPRRRKSRRAAMSEAEGTSS